MNTWPNVYVQSEFTSVFDFIEFDRKRKAYAALVDGEISADAEADVAREGGGEINECGPTVRRAGEHQQLRTPRLHVRLRRVQRVRRRERESIAVRVQRRAPVHLCGTDDKSSTKQVYGHEL